MVESVVQSHAKIVVDSTEKSKIRVLHVDDEPALLRVTKQCLELEGMFQVDSVSSVEEAMAKLEKERYDAVVSDYQMPGKDGLEFLKELRENGNRTPFIMFTGKGREEVAIRALNLGANQYLDKTGETETVYMELAHTITELAKTKKAEELLRLSEERYRNLFDNAKDVIVLFDLKGNVISANKGAEKYGFNKSGMLGKNMLKFVSKRYWPRLLKDVAQIALGKTAKGRIEIHTAKGDKIAEYRSNPIFSDNRVVGIQTVLEDITEHEKAEEELRESEGRYDVLIESINDVFFAMDRDFRYTYWNKASERLTGISAKDAIGKSLTEVFPDVEGTEVEQFYQNTLRTNQHQTFVNKYRMGDKTFVFEIDAYPTKAGLSVFVKDISERKKTESVLKESEERYRDLVEREKDIIYSLDDKGKITFANPAVGTILGYRREETIGKDFMVLIPKELQEKTAADFDNLLKTGEITAETVLLDKKGHPHSVEYSSTVIKDGNKVVGTRGIVRDVTERKKAERESRIKDDALASSISAVAFTDLEGNLTYVNNSFLRMWGYANDREVLGRPAAEFWLSEEKADEIVKAVNDEGGWVGELAAKKKYGSTFEAQLSASLVKDETGKPLCMMGSFIDITERRQAGQSLKESEEKYRRLVELAPDGIVAVNAEGVVTSANRSFLTLVGYDSEEGIVGKPFTELMTMRMEDIPRFQGMFMSLMKGESPSPSEFLYVRRDGTSRWAEVHPGLLIKDGKPVGVQAIMRDVSERKNAEKLIQKNQQKFEQLFMSNPEAAVYVDQNERVLHVNPRFTELFGYSFDEVKGKFLDDFVVPEDRRKEALMLAQKGKEGYVYYETVRKNKKGSPIPVTLSSAPIVLQGQHLGDVVLYKDITERKKAEEELRNSEERLSILFELAPDAYYLSDLKGNFIDGNKAAEKLTGYMKDELIGKSFLKLKLLPRNEALKAAKLLAMNALGKSTGPDELVLNRKDGTQVPVEIRTHPIKIKDKALVLGIARDISIRKKDEQAILESHQKFEGLFRHNPEAAVYLDVNFKIVDVNPCFCQLFGYSAKEVEGRNINEVVVPEGMREEAESMDKDAKNGHVSHDTVRKRKDGSLVHVSISAAPVTFENNLLGYVGIYKDITELKRAQEESEESRKHFQMLFDLMADPVAVVDGRGKILEVTQKVEEITGFKKEELVGKNLLKVKMFGAKTKAVMIKGLAKRMMGMNVQPYEVEVLKKDGGKLMFEINAAKIDYKGKPADLVVFRDVLERKNLEEKLRVVGSLTRHDVRNKLSAVTGNAYLLRRKLAGNAEALEQLADMENAVRNVEAIFEFARTYEKLGVEQLVNTNVGKAVDEAASLFTDLKGIKIVNECHDLTVLADSLLRQLFYNLIDNTLKYGEKTGQIRIYSKTSSADKLELVYEDDGVGIPNDMRSSLFKEGFTSGKGTGYGLFMMKRIIEVYGWDIQETGIQGKGVRFVITMPKTDPNGKENYRLV
jgi:PAS domain S-box-containing protein